VIANAAGWGNIGDDAITLALIRGIAHQRGCPRFALLSGPNSRDIASSSEAEVTVISGSGPLRRVRGAMGLVRAGALVVGGGGLLQDRLPEFYRPFYRAMRVAKGCGVPLSISSVGVSAPRSSEFRGALRELSAYASHFTVRDAASAEIVAEVTGLTAPDIVPDAAFGLRVAQGRVSNWRNADGPRVGVAIRPWWHLAAMWGRADPERLARFIAGLASALRTLRALLGCDFLLIPMHIGTSDDDRYVAHLLEREIRHDGYVTHAQVSGVFSAINAIQSCDALIGMRLHSLILAAMTDVPSVGLAYDDKIVRAMDRIGRSDFVLPIDDFDPRWLADSVVKALACGVTATQAAIVRSFRQEADAESVLLAANHAGRL